MPFYFQDETISNKDEANSNNINERIYFMAVQKVFLLPLNERIFVVC